MAILFNAANSVTTDITFILLANTSRHGVEVADVLTNISMLVGLDCWSRARASHFELTDPNAI